MLKAVRKDRSPWIYQILANGAPVAEIDLSWWRESGTLSIEGKDYQVCCENLSRNGDFVMESAGTIVARAERPGLFQNSFRIECHGRQYALRRASLFGRSFILLNRDIEVGSLRPESLFSRRIDVDLPNDLSLPLRVFITWVTITLRERRAEFLGWGL